MNSPAPHQLKNVVVTGCSSGIGYCLALGLKSKGYRVIATVRNPADKLILDDLGIESCILELGDSESIKEAYAQIIDLCQDNVYALINNGAYGQPGAVEDLNRDTLRQQFEINVFGTQELTNLVIPGMRQRRLGRIIQISSILGFVCLRYRGAYNASKFALEALTDTMRLELNGSGIILSLVEPGPITSKFRDNAYKHYLKNIDAKSSVHKQSYGEVEQRLLSETPVRFNLPPDAVLKPVLHALSSSQPKIRYRVTTPTRIMAPLKRFLPDRWMDAFLLSR